MLEAELGKSTFDEFVKSEAMLKEVGKKLNISELNDVLAAVGYGELSTNLVANKIHEKEQQENASNKKHSNAASAYT